MRFNIKDLGSMSHQKTISWDDRDVIIYAIATGHTHRGIDAQNINWVYEKNLSVLPPFATLLARNAAPTLGDLGADYSKVVLASTQAQFLRQLPVTGTAKATTRVVEVSDKGQAKGAIVTLETRLSIEQADYAIILTQQMARGDGGCGNYCTEGASKPSKGAKPATPADYSFELVTRPDQAALYRLLGDRNPLHIDSDVASTAGFAKPILHGLCTYGIAFQAVNYLLNIAIDTFSLRFAAPVYPGEPLLLTVWQGPDHYYFELLATQRDSCVTASGIAKQITASAT